uniref:DUF4365 domain-containing protein n=1 Tax=Caulobacter sp. (strain K31) TaxID=366602 RepID=B0SWY0_CAUSK
MAWEIRTDRIAEGDVARLCRLEKGRVTGVDEDENGWDLMVEFPPALESAFPDRDPPLRRCIIQVKSTQTRRAATKVKLSNALALTKDDLPCFTVLLTYPKPHEFEAAYLQHMWGSPMMDALFRARKAKVAGKALHKQYVPITFKTADRHDHDVIGALLRAIDEVGPDYAEKKRALREAMGYEDGSADVSLTFANDHYLKDFDDLLLGIRKELPISAASIVEKRFNIPGPKHEIGAGRLSLTEFQAEKCVLTLAHGDEELVWVGKVFKGLETLPLAQRRVRLVGGPLSIILSGNRNANVTWDSSFDTPCPLDELIRDVKFRSWMDGSETFLTIWTERGEFRPIPINFDKAATETWTDILSAVQALARVVPSERRPADLTVSLKEIARQLDTHRAFVQICGPSTQVIRIRFEVDGGHDFSLVTHLVFPWAIRVGEYYLVAVVEREVTSVSREGDQIQFESGNGRILRGTPIKATDATDALLAREVLWARDRAKGSNRRILSFHPTEGGSGDFELTWDSEDNSDS